MNKKQAEKLGKDLLKRMKGKGWKLNIWENLGWCYSVSLGGITIHPTVKQADTKYFALLGNDYGGAGEMYWTENYYSADPNKVVAHQIMLAERFVEKCNKTINSIKACLGVL